MYIFGGCDRKEDLKKMKKVVDRINEGEESDSDEEEEDDLIFFNGKKFYYE